MTESDPSPSSERWSDVWLWTCTIEGCAGSGGEVYWDIEDEEPECPRCRGPMQQDLRFVPESLLTQERQRIKKLEAALEDSPDHADLDAATFVENNLRRELSAERQRVEELEAKLRDEIECHEHDYSHLEAANKVVEELTRERDLAIQHDTQPYPTAAAYEKACAALEKHRARVEELEGALRQMIEWAESGHDSDRLTLSGHKALDDDLDAARRTLQPRRAA